MSLIDPKNKVRSVDTMTQVIPSWRNPHLSPTELAVLKTLVESRGRVVGRTHIARESGIGVSGSRRVDSCLVSLRRTLGADTLLTVRRRGWMLTAAGIAVAVELLQSLPS